MELQKLNKPSLPSSWSYDKSINNVKQFTYKWRDLTKDIAEELWIARSMLNSRGKRTDLTSDHLIRSWTKYCEEIGSSKGVVNKWLKQWFEVVHVSQNSGENEWYTPPKYIEAARKTMGGIDLDPATTEKANELINAPDIFTIKDDGITKKWFGNVWLNPPYGKTIINEFSKAVINNRTNYNQICILVNNATETEWLQNMINISDAICLVKSRIKFIDVNGNAENTPLQGQVILYIGNNRTLFIDNFKPFGICLKL